MIRLFALLLSLAVVNVALGFAVAHDVALASQQVGGAAASQDATGSATGPTPCIPGGACSDEGTACGWTCVTHSAIGAHTTPYDIVKESRRLDRRFAALCFETMEPLQQDRPPKIRSA